MGRLEHMKESDLNETYQRKTRDTWEIQAI
jgi:hypothetical protein